MHLPLAILAVMSLPAVASPFLVAHRGASGDAPENTVAAFTLAWEQGADAIEGDFHLTSDGRIVCFHDADTKKRTGKNLVIQNSTLAELRQLDAGAWKDPAFAGTRIPTFREVADTVPERGKFYIEIKCGPEILPPLLSEIDASALQPGQIVIISFHEEVIRAVKKQRPQWTANLLVSFDRKVADAPAREWEGLLRKLEELRADGLGTSAHPGISRELVHRLQLAGYQHHVWTVNDHQTARRFLGIGTRSVTTDVPATLRKALER